MAKYLVTGGAGFVGSNLVRFLLDKGHDVTIVDNLATGKRENMADFIDRVDFLEADIRDKGVMERVMGGCTAVFHEAALGSVPRSVKDPLTTHDVNANGTVTVLEAARAVGVKRVVFAASSSAYGGNRESPKVETMPTLPLSPYAASKVCCESYMQAYASVYGMETVSLRYFNVFGPYQDPMGPYAAVIPAWISRILHGKQPLVFGDGEQSRDFCYIENVCEANWLAATAPSEQCDGRPINIACNRATTLNQILDLLRELLGTDFKADYEAPRAGDIKNSLANISRSKQVLGYEPKIFLEDGLRKAIQWYRENLS